MDAKTLWDVFRFGLGGERNQHKFYGQRDPLYNELTEYNKGRNAVVEALIEHMLEQHEPRWEYRVETVDAPKVSEDAANQTVRVMLNSYGSEGWEIVSVTPWESGSCDFRAQTNRWQVNVVMKRQLPLFSLTDKLSA